MNHDDLQNKIFDFYDGELTGRERQEVSDHVKGCGPCQTVLEEWKKTAEIFFDAPDHPSQEDFVRNVMARINSPEPDDALEPAGVWPLLHRWLYPAFIAAAVAGFLLILSFPSSESQVPFESLLMSNQAEKTFSEMLAVMENPKDDQILGSLMEDL